MSTLYDAIAAVIGPVAEDTPASRPGTHWLRGQFRGHPVRVGVARHDSRPVGYIVGVDLGGRPVDMSVHDRARTSVAIRPEVRTGDPAFDAVYLVNGYPAEVVRATLEPSLRQLIGSQFPHSDPQLRVEEGELRWSPGAASQHAPGEIAAWVERTVNVAGALARAFDGARARIAQVSGQAAADAWVLQQAAVAQDLAAHRGRRRVRILALAVGLPVLVVIAIMVIGFL